MVIISIYNYSNMIELDKVLKKILWYYNNLIGYSI